LTEPIYQAKDAVPLTLLAESFGEHITLTDQGGEQIHRLLSEFSLGDRAYAVLNNEQAADEEYLLFRIVRDDAGQLELESIDEDEEWEAVAEVYDEMTFKFEP
jgi:uncharacterized protein YrzB (UPF0473 family)